MVANGFFQDAFHAYAVDGDLKAVSPATSIFSRHDLAVGCEDFVEMGFTKIRSLFSFTS